MYKGDDIDLLYVLRPHGWSEILLYVDGEIFRFHVTHLFSEPAGDLAQLAIDVCKRKDSVDLLLWDEPGGHSLRLEQLADQHHKYVVRLCSFPEGPPEPASHTETQLTEFEIKADHLVKLIHGELDKTVKLLEDKSYRENRNFPYADFKRLRSQLAG